MCLYSQVEVVFGTQPNPCSVVNASPPTGTAANVRARAHTQRQRPISMEMSCISHQTNMRCHIPGCCGILRLSHHGARRERQGRLDNSIPEARIKSESLFLTIAGWQKSRNGILCFTCDEKTTTPKQNKEELMNGSQGYLFMHCVVGKQSDKYWMPEEKPASVCREGN